MLKLKKYMNFVNFSRTVKKNKEKKKDSKEPCVWPACFNKMIKKT